MKKINWKFKLQKRHWAIIGLVVALCITGVINHRLNVLTGQVQPVALVDESDNANADSDESTTTFFNDYRTERTTTREQEMNYLNEIIEHEKTDAETLKEANEQKAALTQAMEQELIIEGLVKAQGFNDCVVTISAHSVNVVVDNEAELTPAQTAQILEIVRTETQQSAENVKIIPKN